MKTLRLKGIVGILLGTTLSGYTALGGEFINLGFDQLNWPSDTPPMIPGHPFERRRVEWVCPGWHTTQYAVGYNYTQHFWDMASIVDRDYRNTQYGQNIPAPVVGRFSLMVWPLSFPAEIISFPNNVVYMPYTFSQTGEVPLGSQSLRFLYHGNDLKVFLGGDERTLYPLPDVISGDPQIPLYHYFAVDVSPYAGRTVELRFEFRSRGYDEDWNELPPLYPGEPHPQNHVLDDLSFSPLAVPEPSTWALLGLGSMALVWGTRKQRRGEPH